MWTAVIMRLKDRWKYLCVALGYSSFFFFSRVSLLCTYAFFAPLVNIELKPPLVTTRSSFSVYRQYLWILLMRLLGSTGRWHYDVERAYLSAPTTWRFNHHWRSIPYTPPARYPEAQSLSRYDWTYRIFENANLLD